GKTWWAWAVLAVAGLGGAAVAVWPGGKTQPPARPAAEVPAAPEQPKAMVARLGSVGFRHPGEVHGLAFSPDSKRLSAVGSGAYSGWSVPDGRSLVAVDGRAAKQYRHLTVVSPDGRLALELLNPLPEAKDELYAAEVTDLS